MKFLPLIASALFLFSCKKDNNVNNDLAADPLAALNLPETPYNYQNPDLPDYMVTGPVNAADNTPANNPVTNYGATLGRVIFYDKNLSKNRSISCASCHAQNHAFSDINRLSDGFNGGKTARHSMQLINARYYDNGRFFWDERAATLEVQVLMPIQDEVEMGMSLDSVVARMSAELHYPVLFKNAFGDEAINTQRISMALAQFVRSMVSHRSKYDAGRAMVNNPNDPFPNFTPQENMGKNLFFSPAGNCAPCHGTDAFIAPGPRNNGLEVPAIDQGVGGANGIPQAIGQFKTGTLRNIALTAPYMHDGRFATLEEVIEHYSTGVKNHPNLSPPLRTPDNQVRLANFNPQQKAALVAFLNTLTDLEIISDVKFSDPFRR